ncbi:MAG: LbtU family siderophore porin [Gammaproteobacteria bacterium]|nr:LbtU family siderophore porin [Gammaproteobacteria bacterium]
MKITKILFQACMVSALAYTGSAYASNVNEKLYDLHKRLQKIETESKTQKTVKQEAPQSESSGNVHIHGLVEVEYGYSEDYGMVDSSDIVLATVELGIDAKINNNVDIFIGLLHEEDDTPLEVDVGVINLHDNSPMAASLGQMYVPFGAYETHVVSDPLTLELGETRESAILFNFEANGATAGFYLFNPDLGVGADEDKATAFGVSLGFANDNFSAGVDYISSIADTDAVQDHLMNGPPAIIALADQVAGLSVHAAMNMNNFAMVLEYVGALDQFAPAEISFGGVGAEPSAMNLEFAVSFPMGAREGTLAVAYQATDEAVELGLPETRAIIAVSTEIYDATSLAFEYFRDTDYDAADGGTEETSDVFTIQLATEF